MSDPNTIPATIAVKPLQVSIDLMNEKLHFRGKARNFEPIDMDYTPPIGDDIGHTPLEIFLLSFSACAGGSVLFLLRRMNKSIEALTVNARGTRRAQHPTGFEAIDLEFDLKSGDIGHEEMQKVITLSESTYCPVWSMIRNNVRIDTKFTISAVGI